MPGPSELRRTVPRSFWTTEGLVGVCQNELTPLIVRRVAAAFAACLFERYGPSRPTVVVAGDGRPVASELFAAAAESVRWCGCDLVELGDATASEACRAVRDDGVAGGLLVGNAASEPRSASISFFGAGGAPWSLGGSLDAVQRLYEREVTRPMRSAGASCRPVISEDREVAILAPANLERPLRIVFDTACARLESQLRKQLPASCQLIRSQTLPLPASPTGKSAPARLTLRQRREKMIARQIVADSADLGIWIDGIGEACTVFDDRGLALPVRKLLELLARSPMDELDAEFFYRENVTREAMHRAFSEAPAQLAGDDQGRIWTRSDDKAPRLDGGAVLLRLLNRFDEIGQPLRKLVD